MLVELFWECIQVQNANSAVLNGRCMAVMFHFIVRFGSRGLKNYLENFLRAWKKKIGRFFKNKNHCICPYCTTTRAKFDKNG